MLLDSNIIIYAAQPQHAGLRQLIAERSPAVSVISQIEVLGYSRLEVRSSTPSPNSLRHPPRRPGGGIHCEGS